mgnify:CR=1 FL=1
MNNGIFETLEDFPLFFFNVSQYQLYLSGLFVISDLFIVSTRLVFDDHVRIEL